MNKFFEALSEVLADFIIDNDRWITIHPHGDDSEDYRRLKLEGDETPKEAIERVYKKDAKSDKEKKKEKNTYTQETQKSRELIKKRYELSKQYDKLDVEASKYWKAYTKAINDNTIWYDDSEEVKKVKRDKIEAYHERYKEKADERGKVAKEMRDIYHELSAHQMETVNAIKAKTDIKKNLANYNPSEVTKKIEKVISEHNIDKLDAEYNKWESQHNKEKEEWKTYINSATNTEEQNKRVEEYDNWYKTSETKKQLDSLYDRIVNFKEYRYKAISEALKIENGGEFKLETVKKSRLTDKVKKTNELLTGIINKDYLPEFSPFANGKVGRANAGGNVINISSTDSIPTYIHETMHWIEDMNPKVLANSLAFLEYRTQGEESQYLRKLTGNKKYTWDEVAKPDKFFHPYCGKIYKHSASEIMSMGVQKLFEAPEELLKDKEYFNFVIGNLRGEI